MIRNGRAFTNENGWEDSGLITDKPKEEQNRVLEWIKQNISPRKKETPYCTSYGLKHSLENDIGIYLTNNEFKDAMMIAGYYPFDENALNWTYGISKKSAVFKRKD